MPMNLMQRGQEWWISQALDHSSRDVEYTGENGSQVIKASTVNTRKEEIETDRGRILKVTRTIRIRRAPVAGTPATGRGYICNPRVSIDRVKIDGTDYIVMNWTPVGDQYAKLDVETECVIASERENYRNFNSQ